ncbi:MAG: hypothetical protein JW788_04665, partial [Candidatus Omnitrophica bacterium]|nr:hypothetical protein [Candidatus Omnitrophota bacterium]
HPNLSDGLVYCFLHFTPKPIGWFGVLLSAVRGTPSHPIGWGVICEEILTEFPNDMRGDKVIPHNLRNERSELTPGFIGYAMHPGLSESQVSHFLWDVPLFCGNSERAKKSQQDF